VEEQGFEIDDLRIAILDLRLRLSFFSASLSVLCGFSLISVN